MEALLALICTHSGKASRITVLSIVAELPLSEYSTPDCFSETAMKVGDSVVHVRIHMKEIAKATLDPNWQKTKVNGLDAPEATSCTLLNISSSHVATWCNRHSHLN